MIEFGYKSNHFFIRSAFFGGILQNPLRKWFGERNVILDEWKNQAYRNRRLVWFGESQKGSNKAVMPLATPL